MNYQNKTKEVLINELQKLQQKYNSLETSYAKNIAGCKLEEPDLKQALELQEAIFEGSQDAIFISDQDSRFIMINNAACELTGYSREQLLKMRIPDIHDLPDRGAYTMYHKRIFGGEEILSEAKILHNDGTKIDTEFNNRCVSIAGKLYMHTTARNITLRKRAEEALQMSETRYRELFNNISSGVAIYEVTGNGKDFIFRDFNRAGERIDGDRKEDVIGKSIHQVRPGINKFGLLEVFRRVFETGISEHYPVKFYEDVKLKAWYDNFVYQLPSGEIVAVYDNITERKQDEEALRESEERWHRLVTTIPDYIALHDLKGRFIFLNHYAEGFSEKEVIGKSLYDFISENSREVYRRNFDACLRTKQIQRFIYSAWGDGKVFRIYENNLIPIIEKDQIVNVMAVATDITERKQMEEALRLEKENFRHSLDDSPLGVRIVTMEGNTIYANKTILDLYGYDSLGELQKTPLKDRYTPESYLQAQKRKRQRERGDLSATDYEISIVRKNGEIRHLQVFRKEVLWDGVRQFQVIYHNITERKQAEETIRILARFPSENPDPVLRVDRSGQLLYANEAGYKFLTWKLQIGKKVPSVLQKIITEALKEGIKKIIDTEHNHRVISFSIVPVVEAGYTNLYGRDITERKQAEEEIRKSKKLLEDLHKHLNEILENERAIDFQGNSRSDWSVTNGFKTGFELDA